MKANKEQQEYIKRNFFKHCVYVDDNGISAMCYVTFDTMKQIVEYLNRKPRRIRNE